MTDDELDRLLRAARPATPADEGWAESEHGEQTLAAVRVAAAAPSGSPAIRTLRRIRPFGLGIGLTAAAAVVVGVGLAMPGPAQHPGPLAGPVPSDAVPPPVGATPAQLALAGYDTCQAMLRDLRSHTAAHVTAYGLAGPPAYRALEQMAIAKDAGPVPAPAAAGAAAAPDHSGTNDQEIGADEPDIVKTDGRRVVTVTGGVLRVVDAGTHKVTGTLDLHMYAGADGAQLLLSGNRVLVLLGAATQPYYYRGPVIDGPRPGGGGDGSTFLLVDIAGTPSLVSSLHTGGGYVDARLIGGIARVVVDDTPRIAFPFPADGRPDKQRLADNRRIVQQAPLSAWLPTYQTSNGGVTTTHSVPCDRVSHPERYTGQSMLTVYSLDPGATLDDPHPVSVAADGGTVYASAANLYVASNDGRGTELHRFYVGAPGTPRYVGSGRVPGWLLNSYSMSEYAGSLRLVTTSDRVQQTALYVLDANTLRREGTVGGLGAGEQLHAVRFLGPLAYVVTFESVDPLYVLDLRDPAHPRRAGELTVPGYSDYLHPTDDGRLLGIGQNVDGRQRVTGLQVSLFDVSNADRPSRLAAITRRHTPSETPIDPHAFLYWPATRTAVIPIDAWQGTESGAALVVHVGRSDLRTVGLIRNPALVTADSYDTGIERTLVIGGEIWTLSGSGLQVSGLQSLARHAWIAFG